MNDLEAFFQRHEGRLLHTWRHYFEKHQSPRWIDRIRRKLR